MTQSDASPAQSDLAGPSPRPLPSANASQTAARPGAEPQRRQRAGTFRVQALRSRLEIEPLRQFWESCEPGRDSDLDFFMFVTEHIEGCLRPHVLVLWEGQTPRALLAGRIDIARIPIKAGYFTVPVPELKILRIVHGGFLGELSEETSGLLVSSLIDSLTAGEADAAMLESVNVDSPLIASIRSLPSRFCADRLIHPTIHRMRDMSGVSGPFQSHLSSHARYQQRQRTAKLNRDFRAVRIERYRSMDDLPKLVASAERIAEKSYQRGLGVGFSRTPFVEARLQFEARIGWLRGFVLHLDDEPCAFWIGSLHNGTFVSSYLAFDPSYSEYSPGMYLLLIAMEELWADGSAVSVYDFGIGDAFYKERLSNRHAEEAPLYIFAPRLKPLAINAIRSVVGTATQSIRNSEMLAPQLQKLKRWLRRRAAERN